MRERIVTELGNGFYVVVNPHASNPGDSVQVLNRLQYDVLSKQLNGVINFDTLTENETIAFYNLEKRGLFNDKDVVTNKYPKTLSIWLHVTDQCNMACTYCHVVKKDQHMHDAMLNDFADMLIRTSKNKGLREITLRLAGGEPVLRFTSIHDWIEETRNRLASLDCSLKIAMLSGLASLPTQVVEFVKKPKNAISVSMDGIGEVQDKSRPLVNGEGSFKKVKKNIEKLLENDVSPYIMSVISDDNVDGLYEFTQWLISMDLGFRYSFQKGGELNRQKVAQVLKECYDLIESAVLSGEYTQFHRHRLADLSTFNAQKTACGAGRNTCSVYLDGNIYMCQMQHGNTKPLGNVTDSNDLCEILVDRSEQNDFHDLDDTCKKCHLRANCAGGCPIDRQLVGGHNPNCSLFKEFLPRIHKIHGLKKLKKMIGEGKFTQKFYSTTQ